MVPCIAALIASFGVLGGSATSADLGDARNLRILYAGPEGTPRAGAFTAFLQHHFTTVGTIDVDQLTEAAAAPFDVVIADGHRLYPMKDGEPMKTPKSSLGPGFTRPIVMVSAVGGSVQRHTKIDWL